MIIEKKFNITLKTKSPLRIGGKADPLSGAENPVVEIGGKPAIPGSSLKGVLRQRIEQILIDDYYDSINKRWKPEKLAFQPCIPATELSEDEKGLVDNKKYKGLGCHYPCDTDDKRHGKDKHTICPVCYLFGAQGLTGFVRVPFLFAQITTEELQSLRIDRATKTSVKRATFSYKLIPDGAEFNGVLTVIIKDTALDWELGKPRPLKNNSLGDLWLKDQPMKPEEITEKYLKNALLSISLIGGYKSKGFGDVEITVNEVK